MHITLIFRFADKFNIDWMLRLILYRRGRPKFTATQPLRKTTKEQLVHSTAVHWWPA